MAQRSNDGKDKGGYESYPKDSYDTPPAGPVGVHRGPRSAAARTAPLVAVLVIAVLAALVFWGVFSGEAANVFKSGSSSSQASSATASSQAASSSTASSSASSSASASAQDTATATETPSETPSETATPSESATPEETASPVVNYGTAVHVVNGTAIQGYAAQESAKLNTAGFTDVTYGNPTDTATLPASSIVWYQGDDDLATAQQIASTLGIATVAQSDSIGVPVMVVLMQ